MTPPKLDRFDHPPGIEEVVHDLVSLGLTHYEARVYAALVAHGESKVGVIHRTSGVPRSAVYGTLRRLESRALVDRTAENPARYRAVPPAVALRRTREGVDRAAASALKGLHRLRKTGPPPRSRSLWIAEGYGAVAERLPARLGQAKKEVLVLGPPRTLRRVMPDLNRAASRGVRVVFLSPGTVGSGKRKAKGRAGAPTLASPGLVGEFVVGAVDRRAVFYGAWNGGSEEFVWSENPSFVQFALGILRQLSSTGP